MHCTSLLIQIESHQTNSVSSAVCRCTSDCIAVSTRSLKMRQIGYCTTHNLATTLMNENQDHNGNKLPIHLSISEKRHCASNSGTTPSTVTFQPATPFPTHKVTNEPKRRRRRSADLRETKAGLKDYEILTKGIVHTISHLPETETRPIASLVSSFTQKTICAIYKNKSTN